LNVGKIRRLQPSLFMRFTKIVLPVLVVLFTGAKLALAGSTSLGIFSDQQDVGDTAKTGAASFDPAKNEYAVAGGGENIWATNDAFHYVWKKMSGDFTLAADIKFPAAGGNPHRKACLMIRQSLDNDSAYVDAAVHGVGLTALQIREMNGDDTHEVQLTVSAPERVEIEKRGDRISLLYATNGEELHPAGAQYKVDFQEPFYVGLAVSAHDNKTIERAIFSNVELKTISPMTTTNIESTLETIEVASGDRTAVYHTRDHIEAPNWSRDGKFFLFNSDGKIYRLPVAGGAPELLDTDDQVRCNNDHGLSPDGKHLAVSDQTQDGKSRIYILPVDGGKPRLVTPLAPSYWHGWSPDGKTLAYCAERNGEFDIYTIPAKGGQEKRLTTAPGLDDGPDYSPDGKYIYFNSERTGTMQIWRMKSNGSAQEQITSDDHNNWFAHPSPNGQWIVFISYAKDVKGHPANQDVSLRLMNLADKKITVLAKLFGGQGTINVPSWSPDSRNLAFVSYQIVSP
jgi:tricorn protease-like protein